MGVDIMQNKRSGTPLFPKVMVALMVLIILMIFFIFSNLWVLGI